MEKVLLPCSLEVLDNFLENFLEKEKVLVTTGETREEETSIKGGWLLLVTDQWSSFCCPWSPYRSADWTSQLYLLLHTK